MDFGESQPFDLFNPDFYELDVISLDECNQLFTISECEITYNVQFNSGIDEEASALKTNVSKIWSLRLLKSNHRTELHRLPLEPKTVSLHKMPTYLENKSGKYPVPFSFTRVYSSRNDWTIIFIAKPLKNMWAAIVPVNIWSLQRYVRAPFLNQLRSLNSSFSSKKRKQNRGRKSHPTTLITYTRGTRRSAMWWVSVIRSEP